MANKLVIIRILIKTCFPARMCVQKSKGPSKIDETKFMYKCTMQMLCNLTELALID